MRVAHVTWLVRLLLFFCRKVPPAVYTGRNTETPYLERYFFTKKSPYSQGVDDVKDPPKWGLYLHHFCRGDDDPQLHNHPWAWALSLVLSGGYAEERAGPGDKVTWRAVLPGSFNFLTHNDFHRVDLLDTEHGAWTLFLVGPIIQSWGFWDRVTKVYTPWKRFLGVAVD